MFDTTAEYLRQLARDMDTYQLEGSLLPHVETGDSEVPCSVRALSAKGERWMYRLANVLMLHEQTESNPSAFARPR
jgi:hypothetical protein